MITENNLKKPTFCGMEGDEYTSCPSQEERIEQYLADCKNYGIEPKDFIELIGYTKDKIDEKYWSGYVLRNILENMDSIHAVGCPNDELEKNEELQKATADFISKILKYYKSDKLEEVCRITVSLEKK